MDDYMKKVLAQMEAAKARDRARTVLPLPASAMWTNKDQPKFEFTAEMYGSQAMVNDEPEGD